MLLNLIEMFNSMRDYLDKKTYYLIIF